MFDNDPKKTAGGPTLGDGGIPLSLVAERHGLGDERQELKRELLGTLLGRNGAVRDEDLGIEGPESMSQVRAEQALRSLAHLGEAGPEVLAVVSLHAFEADERTHLAEALKTLATLSPEAGAVVSYVRTIDAPTSLSMEALASLSAVEKALAVRRVLEMVSGADEDLQSDALMALAVFDPQTAIDLSFEILADNEAGELLKGAAFYLSSSGNPSGEPIQAGEVRQTLQDGLTASISALQAAGAQERLAALSWLAKERPELAACIMADRLVSDHDPEIRHASLQGLANISAEAAKLLAPLVTADPDTRVRDLAISLA